MAGQPRSVQPGPSQPDSQGSRRDRAPTAKGTGHLPSESRRHPAPWLIVTLPVTIGLLAGLSADITARINAAAHHLGPGWALVTGLIAGLAAAVTAGLTAAGALHALTGKKPARHGSCPLPVHPRRPDPRHARAEAAWTLTWELAWRSQAHRASCHHSGDPFARRCPIGPRPLRRARGEPGMCPLPRRSP